jgi:hypothetical protein
MHKGGDIMDKPKWNAEYRMNTAIRLAEENIKSSSEWVEPKQIIDFIEELYNYLSEGKP